MGSMIGPITLTVGQPYQVQLAQDTAYIELQNDSLYDVWIYFGEVAPTDLTNANNTWHRVVRRNHNGVLPVEGTRGASASERRNNTIGAFRGTLYLLAVSPGGVAATGTTSGRNQVYLTPYALGDSLPAHSALSTQSDLTSQPRVVALPLPAPIQMSTEVDFAAINTYIQPNDPNNGIFLIPPPLSQAAFNGSQYFRFYLFWLTMSLGTRPAAAKYAQIHLFLSEYNNLSVATFRQRIHGVELRADWTTGTGEQYILTPFSPSVVGWAPANTTQSIRLEMYLNNSDVPASVRIYLNMSMTSDVLQATATSGISPIGGGFGTPLVPGGTAPLF